ncbi:MAG: phosphatidylserine decarboxylase [Sporomusa sp.]|jgi:phosphatidylserine decarboxylase|nr:phosphatidylserine decarboxylase [Sporomusa sp.]
MPTAPISKEGYAYIAILAALTIALGFIVNPYWSIIPGVLAVFTTFFFRNPNRTISNDRTLILSPADGTVMNISEIVEEQFLNCPAIKVSIFLSIFDVHINRSPVAGRILFQQYTCGRYKPAYKGSAPFQNERLSIGLETGTVKILITQVAGIIARRIICWVTLGSDLKQGQSYGMIKFGSCTEVVMPLDINVLVAKGDHVTGGKTIIGKIMQ